MNYLVPRCLLFLIYLVIIVDIELRDSLEEEKKLKAEALDALERLKDEIEKKPDADSSKDTFESRETELLKEISGDKYLYLCI